MGTAIVSSSGSLSSEGTASSMELAAELGEMSEEPPTPTPLSPVGVPSFDSTVGNTAFV